MAEENHKRHSLFSIVQNQTRETTQESYKRVGAWFLGSCGENADLMGNLVTASLSEHANFRKTYFNDPPYIDTDIKSSQEYKTACNNLENARKELSQKLHDSVPFFSERYQAHMNWDTVLPANVGYITAMMYNQNNVATEGGPQTCALEKEVGEQLCSLMGFAKEFVVNTNNNPIKVNPWGHITADGTIANLESMWVARNLKFYPLAVKEALFCYRKNELAEAYNKLKVTVYEAEGNPPMMVLITKPLVACTTWQLLNLLPDEVSCLAENIIHYCPQYKETGIDKFLTPFLIQNKGLMYYTQTYPEIKSMRVFVPATNHYSWPKSGTVLGLGQDSVVGIPVDNNCRMDINILRNQLLECAQNKIPVLMVVGVIGSTEEGVVDNLEGILKLRKETISGSYQFNGLNFLIHCDAAWGGYLRTMMINPKTDNAEVVQAEFVADVPLSSYAQKQYALLQMADTLTVDPHKAGFIPYPAGSLCYRNGFMRYFITFNAAYIHSDKNLNMGIFGLEGSKPGAAAAAVWMAHRTIPLDNGGYGLILGECAFSAKLYYCYWLTLAGDSDVFRIESLVPLPEKITGFQGQTLATGKADIIRYIRNNIIGKTNEQLAKNPDLIAVLQQIGSDVLINSFVVNFKNKDGRWNTDLSKLNTLNNNLLKKFSITTPEKAHEKNTPFIITSSNLTNQNYKVPLTRIGKELGITIPDEQSMTFIINTILHPWPTTNGFINTIMSLFKQEVLNQIKTLQTAETLQQLVMEAVATDRVAAIPSDATARPARWYNLNNSYAGYAKADKNGNELFYWFFESQTKPTEQTPLVLWLNGGPGASSLAGLFLENGPFTMGSDGMLTPNSYSWNTKTHLIYWDQPVGTGFSTKKPNTYVKTETELARQFVNALQDFYAKHPEYRNNPLYLTGESYAGKYLPYIATEITTRNKTGNELKIHLHGIAIGDGWMYPEKQTLDQIEYAYMLGLVDANQKRLALEQFEQFSVDLKKGDMKQAFTDGTKVSSTLTACGGGENIYDVRSWSDASLQPLRNYLGSPLVKQAIHVPQEVVWSFEDAAGPVSDNLINDMMASVTAVIPPLVDIQSNGKPVYQLLFYTGNFDMSCGFSGTEQILRNMNWSGKESWAKLKRQVWYTTDSNNKRVTQGCIKRLANLMQIEVPMSGHQVPLYQPKISQDMLHAWIFNEAFKTYDPLSEQAKAE